MRYAIWNNKGGVGKTFLSFIIASEYAHENPDKAVIVVDMCPQANLSEILLGGNGKGSSNLEKLISQRQTVGGYFDRRIESPHQILGREADFIIQVSQYNDNVPANVFLVAGDPSLEIQAQVINQISSQTLPADTWKNVHSWLKDLVIACVKKYGSSESAVTTFIDCNPSFAAYTELSMMTAERLIVPCSSDGSSARAIDNLGALLYGVGSSTYRDVQLSAKAKGNAMPLPVVHSIILNRSTQYDKKASKAFGAMFEAIKKRVSYLQEISSGSFIKGGSLFYDIPDSHSVAIVCSHYGLPLFAVEPGQYKVHDQNPQVNEEPLDRYKKSVKIFMKSI